MGFNSRVIYCCTDLPGLFKNRFYIRPGRSVRRLFYIFLLAFTFFAASIYAEEGKKKGQIEVPAGMKLEKIGDVNLLVPKDGVLNKKRDGLIFVEEEEAYFARKFLEAEERFKKVEASVSELEAKIKGLENRIGELEDNLPAEEEEAEEDIREIIYE